jgi:hypothetical protein
MVHPTVPEAAANWNACVGVTNPLTTGLPTVRGIFLSNSGSRPILMALAAPEQSVVPMVKNINSGIETLKGESAYEHIELKVTKMVKFGLVNFIYGFIMDFMSCFVFVAEEVRWGDVLGVTVKGIRELSFFFAMARCGFL